MDAFQTKKSDATAASATASASMPIATATSDISPIKSNDDLFAGKNYLWVVRD